MLSGEHIQNQVCFTDVRASKSNVVDEIGQGWSVAKHLLEFERGGDIAAPRLQALLARVTAAAQGAPDGDGALAQEPCFADKLAKAHVAVTQLWRSGVVSIVANP
jgi:alkylation response protein AidB-like acyl-CoA dehydrogenase